MTAPSQKIGLQAILEDASFKKGIAEYVKSVQNADAQTQKASNDINAAGQKMGQGLNAGSLVGVASMLGLAASFGSVISKAAEAERAQALLESVIKSTGGAAGISADAANKLASSISNVSGV